ncbi:hypothetical protein V2G26_009872 [Clonostachys chloroleuca]
MPSSVRRPRGMIMMCSKRQRQIDARTGTKHMVDGPLRPPQEPSGPVHLHLQSAVGQPFAFSIKNSSSVSFFVANTPPLKQNPLAFLSPYFALASAPPAAMAQQSTKQRLALAIATSSTPPPPTAP